MLICFLLLDLDLEDSRSPRNCQVRLWDSRRVSQTMFSVESYWTSSQDLLTGLPHRAASQSCLTGPPYRASSQGCLTGPPHRAASASSMVVCARAAPRGMLPTSQFLAAIGQRMRLSPIFNIPDRGCDLVVLGLLACHPHTRTREVYSIFPLQQVSRDRMALRVLSPELVS